MKILGLDSSGIVASVAIVEDASLTAEYTVNYKKTHSQTLLPMLDELVKMTETTPQAQEKPVFYCVMAGAYTSPARRIMEQAGLCTFDAPDKAVLAAKNMCNYAAFRRRQKED